MLPFRRVLFPIDYSAPCRAVVPYVHDMVTHFGAELTLVHVHGLQLDAITHPSLQSSEDERLRNFAADAFPGLHVNCIGDWGDPGSVIETVVKRQGSDLIMMPTRGEGLLRRLLIGSVTAKVLHDVSAAVWTGAGSALAEHRPKLPYKSVLCAVDLTDEGAAVVTAGKAIAGSYGADLSLVHVIEQPPAALEIDFAPYRDALIDSADKELRQLKAKLRIDIGHKVVAGPTESGIRSEAVRTGADLIVTGRGYAGERLSRIWSRLYEIVREAPCPVLSI